MTDSKDKSDPSSAEHLPGAEPSLELDPELLAAAQKWAEEFNPDWGEGGSASEVANADAESQPNEPLKAKPKGRDRGKTKIKRLDVELFTDDQPEENEQLRTPELSALEVDFAANTEVEEEVAESTEKILLAEVEERGTEESSGAPHPSLEKESVEADAAVIPEILAEDNHQGLMRWDEAINLEAQVEAILFAAPKPISISEISEVLADEDGNEPEHALIEAIVQQLLRLYKERSGGFRLEYDKGAGFQFRTVPAAAPIMERMFSSRQRPLSRAAHETLAIIAYRQPCTRADIEFIRGVDAGSIIKNLLERDLVACVGRKEDSGRPMLFGTTAEFMRVFRIQSLNDLPPLSAFQPATEAILDAFQKIEQPDFDIEIEGFVGDPNRADPEMSVGMASDFAKSDGVFEVREDGSKASTSQPNQARRSGGIFDNEGFPSDGNAYTEVALPVGDSLAERSGKDASGRSNQHQRQSGSRSGDEDPS